MNKLTISEKKYLRPYTKKHILLPTKHKKPLVKGWNKFYAEKRSIEELLTAQQEYSLRTGTRIGAYYFLAIDLDDLWAKERIKVSRYIETSRGIHRYVWIKELPKSCWLVNKNGEPIGQLHSKGRFVVGIGSIHKSGVRYSLKGRNSLKWLLKFEKLIELQEFLKARNIWATPWNKKGLENVRDLEPYYPKPKKLSKETRYYQQKEELEKKVQKSKEDLNICYLCLVVFAKLPKTIKEHLQGKRHQQKYQEYLRKIEKKNKI